MSKGNLLFLFLLLLLIIGAGVYTFYLKEAERFAASDLGGATFTDESGVSRFTDLEGNPVTLADYAGKTVVVNVWATWCPFCVTELPDFQTLAAAAGDDVVVLAINRAESQPTVAAFYEHVGSPEQVLFVLDPSDTYYESIGGFAMPETIFYAPSGEIAVHKRGFMNLAEMQQHLEAARNPTE